MGNASIKSVLSGLACADLWKYVFNSMECHSHCCDDDGCECDCNTSEVDIEEDSDEGISDACMHFISKLDSTYTCTDKE